MILGLGIDIIEIDRIARAINNLRFLERIYTLSERNYLGYRKNNPHTAAGNFAAKEAVVKALGTGFGAIKWTDIEVLRDRQGRPYVILHQKASEVFRSMGGYRIWVSISHSRRYATAQVIIEGGRKDHACGNTLGNEDNRQESH